MIFNKSILLFAFAVETTLASRKNSKPKKLTTAQYELKIKNLEKTISWNEEGTKTMFSRWHEDFQTKKGKYEVQIAGLSQEKDQMRKDMDALKIDLDDATEFKYYYRQASEQAVLAQENAEKELEKVKNEAENLQAQKLHLSTCNVQLSKDLAAVNSENENVFKKNEENKIQIESLKKTLSMLKDIQDKIVRENEKFQKQLSEKQVEIETLLQERLDIGTKLIQPFPFAKDVVHSKLLDESTYSTGSTTASDGENYSQS